MRTHLSPSRLVVLAGAAALATGLAPAPQALHAAAPDPALQAAPADGWAGQAGGTTGGSRAAANQIYTVHNRQQLLAALNQGDILPKIVKVVGTIDMSEGVPFTSAADQKARSQVKLPSNTTLIGAGPGAGFIHAWLNISGVSNVIVRNLRLVAPCDVAPVWDPTDGATGSWNAAYDAISVTGADHVWIDRNTITDVPVTDNTLPVENGKTRQCHDGAIDITKAADYVTVSYNVIEQHDKTLLIGSSDSGSTAAADIGRLRVTLANNHFHHVTQRSPRVRFGQVHVLNNLFTGAKGVVPYGHSYSIGVGKSGQVMSHGNVFNVTGAASCADVLTTLSADAVSSFRDSGSLLNGAALGACPVANTTGWAVPYAFAPRPAALVRANVLAQAGAGRISTAVTGTGSTGLPTGTRVPASGAMRVHTDTSLQLAFDGTPTLGTAGRIRVVRSSDGTVVDTLDVSNAPSATDTQTVLPRHNLEMDAIGLGALPENPALARWVWYRPVSINGNVATIRLRNNRLAFNTAYHVLLDNGVLQGTVNGAAFAGITSPGAWQFTTRPAPASPTSLRVSADGADSADFSSLQGALNWVMTHCSSGSPSGFGCNTGATAKTITLAPGIYREMNLLRRVNNLSVVGDSRDGVIVGDVNFESLNAGSGATSTSPGTGLSTSGRTAGHRVLGGGRASWLVEGADLLTLRNFTLRNPHERSSAYDNQAEAVYFNTSTTAAAGRLVAREMNFLSEQDTLQLKGYVWVYRSLVAGNVDFIWGSVMAALFEESEIRSVFDNASSSAGFILQSRATAGDKGFVFLNSSLTAGPGVSQAWLARSGGTTSTTYTDNIAFINTRMGPHILPQGWCVGTGTSKTGKGNGSCGSNPPPWSGTGNGGSTDAAGWREWGSRDLAGHLLDVSGRLGSAIVTVGGLPSTVTLAKPLDATTGLATRAEVFVNSTIATGAPGGWVPAP